MEILRIVFFHLWIRCNIGWSRVVFYICYFSRSERGWRTEDSIFRDGESREYLYSRTLFFSRPPREFLASVGLNGGGICTQPAWETETGTLRAPHARFAYTYSIVPCNSQEVHKPLVDFGMHTELYWNTPTSRLSCELPLFDYHLRIFQGETMSLGISCVRFYIEMILFQHRKDFKI